MRNLKERIAQYRAERQIEGGYVVTYDGEISGWIATLDSSASGWVPWCVAYDVSGNKWVAVGGDEYDGAEKWEVEQS